MCEFIFFQRTVLKNRIESNTLKFLNLTKSLGEIMNKLIIIAIALTLGGCSTVTRGTTNKITFESNPGGARVQTTAGNACSETPCIIEVPRKTTFVAKFSKAGYQDQSVPVNTRLAGAGAAGFAGNVLVGGVIGMGVDAATGATLEHYPNPVRVDLVPIKGKRVRSPSQKRPES